MYTPVRLMHSVHVMCSTGPNNSLSAWLYATDNQNLISLFAGLQYSCVKTCHKSIDATIICFPKQVDVISLPAQGSQCSV